jgi:methionine aminotransferase
VSDLDDAAFCRWLTIEKGVAAIPLSPFYETAPRGQRLARLCFAKNEVTLDAAIERLQKL